MSFAPIKTDTTTDMNISGMLVFFHCKSNTGYAIGRLEPVFYEMAKRLTEDINKIHFGYSSLSGGKPIFLPSEFKNVICFDTKDLDKRNSKTLSSYIKDNNIDVAFGFDQPVSRPAYSAMRKAGIKLFISYVGAPMSSINYGIKLLLKKFEVRLKRNKPDHFIFESKAMLETAVSGRGINPLCVSVIPTGVDTEKFKPSIQDKKYAHRVFGIPNERRIIFYSGHMEERKGVHIIVEAANLLIRERKRNDVHFLFLGNMDGQEKRFAPMYTGTASEQYITFGGYRDDINRILPSSYVGVIASTGWDSFPMSSLEMASSGLPLIASKLQGIVEGIENDKTGYLIEPGDHSSLADRIEQLLDDPQLHKDMSIAAREWILSNFSREQQIENLTATVQRLYSRLDHNPS